MSWLPWALVKALALYDCGGELTTGWAPALSMGICRSSIEDFDESFTAEIAAAEERTAPGTPLAECSVTVAVLHWRGQ